MAKLAITPGSANITIPVWVPDSASTTGAGKTGIAYNAAGLVCYYWRPGSSAAQLTLATQTVNGAHSDGGWVEVNSTNMPGLYRLDLSDAIVAAGVRSVVVLLKGASGMAPVVLEIDLAAESTVAAYASGQTPLQPTVAGRTLDVSAGGEAGIDWANVGSPTTTVALTNTTVSTGQQVGSVTGAVGSISGVTFPSNFGTLAINGSGHVTRVANVDAVTAVSSGGITSGSFAAGAINAAAIAADAIGASELAADAATEIATAVWAATGRDLSTSPPTAVQVRQEMDSNSTKLANLDVAVSTRLATAGYTAPPTAAETADKILGRSLAGSADGGRTVRDALRFLRNKWAISGSTLTVYQEDDATSAWTSAITASANQNPVTVSDPA